MRGAWSASGPCCPRATAETCCSAVAYWRNSGCTTPEKDENRRDKQRRKLRLCLRPLLQEKLEEFETRQRVECALVDAERIEHAHFLELRTLFGEYALRDSPHAQGTALPGPSRR